MAYCPECRGEMGPTEIVCPHCGHDFAETSIASIDQRTGFAYSPVADLALLMSTFVGGAAAVAALFGVFFTFFARDWYWFALSPFVFFHQVGLFVALLRVQDLTKDS